MLRRPRLILLTLTAILSAAPPPTKRTDFAETLHGVRIEDPYRWLEDSKSEETRRWVKAQSEYARAFLDKQPGRGAIGERLEALTRITSSSIGGIAQVAGKLFFERHDPADNQPVLYVQNLGRSAPRVLVDPNSGEKASLSEWSPSPDGKWLAYATAVAGSDWQVIRIRSVEPQ